MYEAIGHGNCTFKRVREMGLIFIIVKIVWEREILFRADALVAIFIYFVVVLKLYCNLQDVHIMYICYY